MSIRDTMEKKISWYALGRMLDGMEKVLLTLGYRVSHHSPREPKGAYGPIVKHLYAALRHIKAANWETYKLCNPNIDLPKYDLDRLERVAMRARFRAYIAKYQAEQLAGLHGKEKESHGPDNATDAQGRGDVETQDPSA